ncbi:MAG: redoxin family protein [Phycisphaerales bacterium]
MNAKSLFGALMIGAMVFSGAVQAQETAPKQDKAAQPERTKNGDAGKTKEGDKLSNKGGDKSKEKEKGVAAGDTAPDFKLKDTDGKEHTLSELTKAGKVVVIQWFNPECPYIKKHYGNAGNTFNDIYTKYNGKDVVLVAINSNADGEPGSGDKANAKMKKEWKIEFPILLDPTGATGMAYGAKNTPAMYIVGKDGKVAYSGAIDDDSGSEKPGKSNYVTKALDQILAGESVSTSYMRPYGCRVKYAEKKK